MAKLKIRIEIEEKGEIGPGKARLLELIGEKGSIRRAAAAMDMSYRRAWLLVRETEAVMGGPVIATETGGTHGGGALLTALGRSVITRYRDIEKRASASVAAELRALTRAAKAAHAVRQAK